METNVVNEQMRKLRQVQIDRLQKKKEWQQNRNDRVSSVTKDRHNTQLQKINAEQKQKLAQQELIIQNIYKQLPILQQLQLQFDQQQQIQEDQIKSKFTDWQIHCLQEGIPVKTQMKQPLHQLVQTPDSIPQQQQTTLNTTEKRVDYTEQEKKIAALRLSRLGEQHYEEEREIQMKYHKVVIPSVSTAKRQQKVDLEKVNFFDAHIGLEFDPAKDLSGVEDWKTSNKLSKDQIIKAILQLDAIYVNKQVYFDEFGIPHNTILHKGQEKAIQFVFAFVLVTECEADSLPIFCQLSATGSCSQRQLDTYFIICKTLLKYNIQCDFLAHDCDPFYNRIEKYPFFTWS
ncbi:Hypothetical_protein [Hexamita inflata]|uniref:Hypothetical_protein n=1 Tax=Hexamita inflata TaxID=28002 RepID=A0AA86U0K2_9EUKA|nr:Hypothetical protein HINF_LOCUS24810 [Hexamita inflata]